MVIGIDLGTTFSVAAYVDKSGTPRIIPNRDGTNIMPSVVMFDYGEVTVGIQAKNNAVTSPYNVAQFAKRHMGTKFEFPIEDGDGNEKLYSPEDISALILRRLKKDSEEFLGQEITAAVITVPAYFTDAQKRATIAAGKIAGLKVLKVIPEPTAAAMAFGLNKAGEHMKVLIYDLGGGTFDVTAAEIEGKKISVLATHGYRDLGGFDFDNLLIEYASKQIKDICNIDINEDLEDLQLLRQRCEEAKIALSTRSNYTITMKLEKKNIKIEISREQFEAMILPLLETTGDSIDIVLEEGNISTADIDKVLLVGGSSIIPAVGEYVHKKLGIQPSAEVNPYEVVAIGAAICADSFDEAEETLIEDPVGDEKKSETSETKATGEKNKGYAIVDRNSHGFGVEVRSEDGELENSVIIPRNQPLGKFFTKVYYSVVDYQEEVCLTVTEGEDTDLRFVTEIGESIIKFNPHPKDSPIAVEFVYDDNGIITGRIYDLFGVEYETDYEDYLIGDVGSLDNPVFIAEVTIKREYSLGDEDIEEKRRSLDELNIQ